MRLNQSVLVSHGVPPREASNIMGRIEFLVGRSETRKETVRYMREGKPSSYIIFMKSVDLNDAVKALGTYVEKKPYSRRLKVEKWQNVLQLLKSIKEKNDVPIPS